MLAVTASIDRVDAKIKNVEFLVDRSSNRRIGYVVTKVHPIDRKDDFSEKNSTKDDSKPKIDRNTIEEEEHGMLFYIIFVN